MSNSSRRTLLTQVIIIIYKNNKNNNVITIIIIIIINGYKLTNYLVNPPFTFLRVGKKRGGVGGGGESLKNQSCKNPYLIQNNLVSIRKQLFRLSDQTKMAVCDFFFLFFLLSSLGI